MVAKGRDLGEACTAVNRIYLHASVETQFVEKFTAGLATLKITDGLDPSVDVGPLVNVQTRDKAAALVDDALSRVAQQKLCGIRPDD